MPEGDTISYAARRIRPVLEGHVPDEIRVPQSRHALDRWPQRLNGRAVTSIDTHGKHLFLRFEGGLALHSHLRMSGSWGIYPPGRRWHRSPQRAWIVFRAGSHEVVEFDGPLLELLTEGRTRFDRRLAALGPDILAQQLDGGAFLQRLRDDDPTRGIGDALLEQSTIAGIGNVWKAEGCWEALVDPWRALGSVSDAEALAIIERVRPRMLRSAELGPRSVKPRVYGRAGRPCPRCGSAITTREPRPARSAPAEEPRTTYWCPGCQS